MTLDLANGIFEVVTGFHEEEDASMNEQPFSSGGFIFAVSQALIEPQSFSHKFIIWIDTNFISDTVFQQDMPKKDYLQQTLCVHLLCRILLFRQQASLCYADTI